MDTTLEGDWWAAGLRVAGVDEAGRGALAGPLVAAAVILPPGAYLFRDSKTLSARQRSLLEGQILQQALTWAIGVASARQIEQLGVLKATHLAALEAVHQLIPTPQALLTDYLRLTTPLPLRCPPRADRDSLTVAAASILAKEYRDRLLLEFEERYPGYGWSQHKGYGTAQHLAALNRLGPCPEHRTTFAPVAQARLWP